MISRITGGDPMGATQFNHGRQAEELIEAGLLDLTDLAEGRLEGNRQSAVAARQLHPGRAHLLCAGQHSLLAVALALAQGIRGCRRTGADQLGRVRRCSAGAREGRQDPARARQPALAVDLLFGAVLMSCNRRSGHVEADQPAKDADGTRAGNGESLPGMADAREMAKNSTVQDWNQATNMVITGEAGGQIMGDWAQGEFQVADQKAGEDYSCLPGLGVHKYISTGGDAFYFPKNDDPEVTAAQKELASLMLSKEVQVAFNLKKGSLPVRGDVDLAAANDCMKQGLEILHDGNMLPSGDQVFSADTQTQFNDLMVEFMKDPNISAEDAQERYADIVANAD
jgi:glucose/mannose transport system substrate-binding protein